MTLISKKSLGQNFLASEKLINLIVDTGNINNGDTVLEVGPGKGALTQKILEKKPKKLIVIEKDARLVKILKEKFENKINIINKDMLNVSYEDYFTNNLIIFGNLPYNISTKILTNLLAPKSGKGKWEILLLMFQLEVANRIVAMPNTKQYGRLSLFSQFYSCPSFQFQISKTSFFPVPKVESALVKFQRNNKNDNKYNSELFQEIIRKSFQGRRKLIKNTLKTSYSDISAIMEICNIPHDSRPENVTLEQFCELTYAIEKYSSLN